MQDSQEATYINSLSKFERRCIHHHMLYAWVDAFKHTMPLLSVKKAISYFYFRHGVEEFNERSSTTEYARIQREVFPLISNGYFKLENGNNLLNMYERKVIVINMLYSWCAATRTIMPNHTITEAINRFFTRHGVKKHKISQFTIELIYNKVRLLEKKNYIEFGKVA